MVIFPHTLQSFLHSFIVLHVLVTEPYKAAVKPIVPLKRKPVSAFAPEGAQQLMPALKPSSQRKGKAASAAAHPAPYSKEGVSKEDYEKILKEKEELEKQLKINSKVIISSLFLQFLFI